MFVVNKLLIISLRHSHLAKSSLIMAHIHTGDHVLVLHMKALSSFNPYGTARFISGKQI